MLLKERTLFVDPGCGTRDDGSKGTVFASEHLSLRRLTCAVSLTGGDAVIVSSLERADNAREKPVYTRQKLEQDFTCSRGQSCHAIARLIYWRNRYAVQESSTSRAMKGASWNREQ